MHIHVTILLRIKNIWMGIRDKKGKIDERNSINCSAVRQSSAGAPAFFGQPELRCFLPAPAGKNDRKCDNFKELVLVTTNGNIEFVEST